MSNKIQYWSYRTARVVVKAKDNYGYPLFERYSPTKHPMIPFPNGIGDNHCTWECNDPRGRYCTLSDDTISFGDVVEAWYSSRGAGEGWVEMPKLLEVSWKVLR